MGNASSCAKGPEPIITQSHRQWEEQVEELLKVQPTQIKMVLLPPGVSPDDERLQHGTVVSEETYVLEAGQIGDWINDSLEVNVDTSLFRAVRSPPPNAGDVVRVSVRPNDEFEELACPKCAIHRKMGKPLARKSAPTFAKSDKKSPPQSVDVSTTADSLPPLSSSVPST